MFGLLINPRPHQDESLLGYLQRLAKANGLPRKELLTAFARADETDVADWLQMMEGPLSWPAVSAEFRDPRPKGGQVMDDSSRSLLSDLFGQSRLLERKLGLDPGYDVFCPRH